jgi:hypothetical protein
MSRTKYDPTLKYEGGKIRKKTDKEMKSTMRSWKSLYMGAKNKNFRDNYDKINWGK